MIENVVFDLGGVVIGRDYDRYGAEIAEFSFLQGDRPFPEYWKRYDLGTASREEVVEAVSCEHGISPELASVKLERLMTLFNEFADTVELIAELAERGYGLYVLSNMPAEFYRYVSDFGVFRHFRGEIISSRERLAKPDPRIFALLAERYGIVPERTLFIDDKKSNTDAAKRLGFKAYTFTPGVRSCDEIRAMLEAETKR